MKCPLFRAVNITSEFDSNWTGDDCLKEECAWWDRTAEKCVMLQLAFELDEVHTSIEELVNKMHHEEQSGN